MTEEGSTAAHLSVAMTTDDVDETQTATGNTVTSSSSSYAQFYFRCAVVIMGVVGTVGNGLILYALVAAKQHKKLPLIVNRNDTKRVYNFPPHPIYVPTLPGDIRKS